MKKTLLVVAALFTVGLVNAQTEKGNMIVGGDVSLDFATNKAESNGTTVDVGKTTEIEFSPQFGYFVMDRLAIGAELTYQSETFKPDGGGGDDKFSLVGLGPFVKYYLENGIFGQLNAGFGSGKFETTNGQGATQETKYSASTWRLGVGYAAFLNEHIAVEPMLSYGSDVLKNKDTDVKSIDNSFRISVGFTIFLN